MPGLLIGLIVDRMRIAKWQADALTSLAPGTEFILLNCTNTHFSRRPVKYGLYYLLNIVSLRSRRTSPVPVPDGLKIRATIDFESEYEGAWQRLPAPVIDAIRRAGPARLLKFGMGLLRVPDGLGCPILSYHHGDPRRFRGRPAGFHELSQGEALVGQVIQILSNRLDSGKVVAFAQTRVLPHSYKKTMAAAYACSPLLLRQAISNLLAGRTVALEPGGKNYRLPSNLAVLQFAAKLVAAKVGRLVQGALVEKEWQCASAPLEPTLGRLLSEFPPASDWLVAETPRQYSFLADPFPHPAGGLIVEALRRSDGQGDIVHIGGGQPRVLCTARGHYSYPATIDDDGTWFIVPEMAEWSEPRVYRVSNAGAEDIGALAIECSPRIVDPTLLRWRDGRFYLFGNKLEEGGDVLRLWSAESLFGRFSEHPASPVRISPLGARMAGKLFEADGELVRPGQDNSRSYGDGVFLFRVSTLSSESYEEVQIGEVRLGHVRGPHTLNFDSGKVIFDFYDSKIEFLAGLRRIRSRIAKRRAQIR